jgi:hypothetical protein
VLSRGVEKNFHTDALLPPASGVLMAFIDRSFDQAGIAALFDLSNYRKSRMIRIRTRERGQVGSGG